MKQISLTQGQFAVVDNTDYEWLNQWTWHAVRMKDGSYLAKRSKGISMSRQILGLEVGDKRKAQYINKDSLNNKRNNLRIASKGIV